MAWSSGPRYANITDTVALNCGQGIECGYDEPDVNAVHCLCTSNAVGARFGDNYDWSYHGFLKVRESLLLFNLRDVWGRAWDNWTVHLSQTDIQDNYLSVPNENYPNNLIWDPQGDPNQRDELATFLPTDANTVGIGLATAEDTLELSKITNKIPVRLSTFTTNAVSVDYAVYTDDGLIDSGTLQFIPGETVKHIQFDLPPIEGLRELSVTLSNPVNAKLTGYGQINYAVPYEIVEPLILEGDQWRYFKGTEEPPTNWNLLEFNDADWLSGPTGIGFEAGTGYESCIATNLSDMQNNYISVYARREFVVENPSRLKGLILTIDWDDGYIAYINGVRVDSRYAPDPPTYDEPATTSNHEACCGTSTPSGPCPPEQVDLSNYIGELAEGVNVLAIQVHNQSISSSDFLFIPELYSVVVPWPGDFEPDGDVDYNDFALLASAWLTKTGEERYNPLYDINVTSDGIIDMLDLMVFADNWLLGDN